MCNQNCDEQEEMDLVVYQMYVTTPSEKSDFLVISHNV